LDPFFKNNLKRKSATKDAFKKIISKNQFLTGSSFCGKTVPRIVKTIGSEKSEVTVIVFVKGPTRFVS
jgi:hypothetical protein